MGRRRGGPIVSPEPEGEPSDPRAVVVPDPLGERTVGVFNAVSSEPYAFDPAEERYLASLGAVIAVAMGAHLKDDEREASDSE